MRLILQDVRCFQHYHEVAIRPLTFLIGENSSGKTTFLAALAAVLRREPFPYAPGLADQPYGITSFDAIASHHGGAAGRATSFSLGSIRSDRDEEDRLIATYGDNFGQPILKKLETHSRNATVSLEFRPHSIGATISRGDRPLAAFDVKTNEDSDSAGGAPTISPSSFHKIFRLAEDKNLGPEIAREIERQLFFPFFLGGPRSNPISIAPIRTKPLAAYPQATDQYQPEGDHIPLLLARAFDRKATPATNSASLTAALSEFGERSGLFREIRVKRLGSKPSDPFQLLVKIATQTCNISDVGYGVSQALPIAVQTISGRKSQQYLIQQPEVHLHPKAQAAMGSLFVQLYRHDKKCFVVETHSDYLLDRIRLHVAAGDLDHRNVCILYFDRSGRDTDIHKIDLDRAGNVQNAPSGYRKFFIEEQVALLGGY